MKKNLAGTIKAEDDATDALSTSTNNSGQHSGADNNLARLENFNSEEFETLCDGSKKIRKKRNAYQKIDDGVRLKLLEAVKHGETLKSAAKKFKINYSSAKSILHTYRKEGRILKKSAQERNIKRNPTAGGEMGEDGSPHQSDNENNEEDQEFKENFKGRSEVQQMETGNRKNEGGKVEAMNNGQDLVDNLVNILKMNGNRSMSADNGKVQGQSLKVTKVASKPARMEEEQKVSVAAGNNEAPVSGNMQSPTSLIHLTQMLQGNSMEKFKMLDNIFANISNSPFPIVTKAIKAYTDSSGSKTEGAEKELELSEEVNNSQNQPKQSDEICMPHPLRFNTAQLLQERVENKLNNEDPDWDVTIENAAIDTFKSFMDAQLLLCDALKKASYLNSLMQAQKAKTEGNLVQGQIQSLNNA